MSPRRTRRGTVRESVSEVDSSMRSASKSAKKTRQTRKSLNTINLEEDSDGTAEQSNNSIVHSQTARSTRKRKQENKDKTLNESRSDSRAARSTSKAPKSKRQTRVAKQQVSGANSMLSEDEGSNAKNESKSSKSTTSKSSASNSKVSGNVTPESSSPIAEPPIPHRSTKTPKKSPSNLGSPKTHSRTTLRSFKVPRKLSVDSLPSSEQSNNDSLFQQSSFSGADKSVDKSKNSPKLSKVSSIKKKVDSPILKIKSGLSKSMKTKLKSPKSKTPVLEKKSPSSRTSLIMEKSLKVDLSNSLGLKTSLLNESSFKLEKSRESALQESTKSSEKDTSIKKSRASSKQSPLKSSNTSLLGAKRSPKVVLSTGGRKSSAKSSLSPSSLRQSKLLNTSLKSKKSPKFFSSFTPGKTPKIALSLKSSIAIKQKKSPLKKEKSPIKKVSEKSVDKMNLSLDASMSPKVMLKKLSGSDCNSKSPKSKRPSLATKFRTSVSKATGNIGRKSTKSVTYTPVTFEKRLSQLKPLTSSTPREKVKPKQSTLSSDVKSKISKKLSNRTNSKVSDKLLDDESEPSMDESSLVHLSAVYDTEDSANEKTFGGNHNSIASVDNEAKRESKASRKSNKNGTFEDKSGPGSSSKDKTNKNDTYEVEYPKTPKFQNRSNKRKADEAHLSMVEGRVIKRSCKVQFATPVPKTRGSSLGINRVGTPGHAIRKNKSSLLAIKRSPIKQSPVNKEEIKNRTSQVLITRLKNLGNTPLNQTPENTPLNKKLLNSASGNSALKSNINSKPTSTYVSKMKPFVRLEKKLESKTPAGKIPNFGEIHQKSFAKMESLIDMRKRVEERHVTLRAPTSSTKKVPPSSGTHNRFGWPVRKGEATEIISNNRAKGNVDSSDKRREKTRTTLKGVRMNRRFELQMKLRMKNS